MQGCTTSSCYTRSQVKNHSKKKFSDDFFLSQFFEVKIKLINNLDKLKIKYLLIAFNTFLLVNLFQTKIYLRLFIFLCTIKLKIYEKNKIRYRKFF